MSLEGLLAPLGVAAPLVGILYYLLRQATDERRELTRMYLQALTTSQAANTEALQAVQAAMRTLTTQTTTEHIQITSALTAVADRRKEEPAPRTRERGT